MSLTSQRSRQQIRCSSIDLNSIRIATRQVIEYYDASKVETATPPTSSCISHMSATEYIRRTNSVEETTLTRTMVPLKLAWAWTIWKVQGQTVDGKVVVSLGRKEVEHGLSYVVFSRVRRFQDIGIIRGVSGDRLTSQIAKRAKFKKRPVEDARLNLLETQTLASLLPTV